METNEQSRYRVDLSAVRDQITRRIWDMTQISLQGPGYARGYADGLSESLVLLDKAIAGSCFFYPDGVEVIIEEIRDNLINFKSSDPDQRASIDQMIVSINSLMDKIKAHS